MKRLNLLLFLLLMPLLYSCNDKCEGIDCLSEDSFAFTIKSAESGEDLLFGSTAQLDQDEVEVYYMQNGTKQTAQVHFGADHAAVAIVPEIMTYHITVLDRTDDIKLAVSGTGPSDCCPRTQKVELITVNNQIIPRDSWVITLTR